MVVCIRGDLHLCTNTPLAKSIIITHGHCFYPQESANSGVCYYYLEGCVLKKPKHFHLFVTIAAFS